MQSPIIYSVLNWGLGHATRSVPVIQELLKQEYEVHLASSGDAYTYLKNQFPSLPILNLPDYEVSYPTKFMPLNVVSFAYSMMTAIRREKNIIGEYAADHNINISFSDNRYGCYLEKGKSFFISHQLNIKTGDRFSSYFGNNIQRRWLRKFDHILVPDFRQMPNLAGELSRLPDAENISYLGPLSSYETPEKKPIKYQWCCILSGVEPQRSRLEEKLYDILDENKIDSAIITGKEEPSVSSTDTVEVFPLLNKNEVQKVVSQSKNLCLRSGYSSIMDLCVWRKPALLIPTPGQTEQEYLADYISETYGLHTTRQSLLEKKTFHLTPKSADNLPVYNKEELSSSIKKVLSG